MERYKVARDKISDANSTREEKAAAVMTLVGLVKESDETAKEHTDAVPSLVKILLEAEMVHGVGTGEGVREAVVKILYKLIVDVNDKQVMRNALLSATSVDIEVFLRNISLKHSTGTLQNAGKILALTLLNHRKQCGIPTAAHTPQKIDLKGQISYCEIHERNKILRKYWELSNTLGVLSLIKQKDLQLLGMMMKAHGAFDGGFAETSEEDVILAVGIVRNWCMAVLRPFYDGQVPFFDPEMLDEVLGGLFHVVYGTPRPRTKVLVEEAFMVLILIASAPALLPTVSEQLPYATISQAAPVHHSTWTLLALCTSDKQRSVPHVLNPANRLLPLISAALIDAAPNLAQNAKLLVPLTAILGNLAASPGGSQELLSSGFASRKLPEFLKEIVSRGVMECPAPLIVNICVLYANLLPSVETSVEVEAYIESLCEVVRAIHRDLRSYDKGVEQILTGFTLAADGNDSVKKCLINKSELFKWIAWVVCNTEPRTPLNEAAMGVLAVCNKGMTAEAAAILKRNLIRVTKGYITVGDGDTFTIPIGTLVLGAVIGLASEADRYSLTAEVLPWVLDTMWTVCQEGTTRGARDLYEVLLSCVSKFTATNDGYLLTIAWRCCGLETAADLHNILLTVKHRVASRDSARTPYALKVLADVAVLPAVAAGISGTPSFLPSLVDVLQRKVVEGQEPDKFGLLLLSRLTLYDSPTAKVVGRREEFFKGVMKAGREGNIAAEALVNNVLGHQEDQGIEVVKEMAAKWEEGAAWWARFEREYGRRFQLAKEASERRLATALRDELYAYKQATKPPTPDNLKWLSIRSSHERLPTPHNPRCSFCHKPPISSAPAIPCPSCRMVSYCSQECLEFHLTSKTSKNHASECAVLRDIRMSSRAKRAAQHVELAVLLVCLVWTMLFIFWFD